MKSYRSISIALLPILFLFTSCADLLDGLGSNKYTIRPAGIDLNGVAGFAVVDNSEMGYTRGEGDDTPQALYSIDKNGDIKITIFYFEATEDSKKTPDSEVMKEISNALQVIPALVTDLGKYIVFSGCQYQIIDYSISDKAREICESFIEQYGWYTDIVYMIRKSDGALFDLTEKFFFGYCIYEDMHEKYFPQYMGVETYIPSTTYQTSIKNNLFVRSSEPNAIFKVEDNGDAVDFKQMTQADTYGRFCIDAEENIYIINGMNREYSNELHIYKANGGFNLHRFKTQQYPLDIITDESGNAYLFTVSMDYEVQSTLLSNGKVETISKWTLYDFFKYKECLYLGLDNDCYNWCDYKNILSYNRVTHEWALRSIATDVLDILSKSYDTIIYGSKTYCARVNGSTIEVIEIDFISETYRTYSLNVDMSSIIPSSYGGKFTQGIPYLTIGGRSPYSGASVSFSIDLINGTNNSTYAPDGRNVVSFFRIN